MNERNRWIFGVAALVMLLAFTAVAYNLGVSQGLEQAAANVSAGAPSAPYDGWHRHWSAGPLFPLLLIFLWFVLMRMWWWGRPRPGRLPWAGRSRHF